MTEAEWLTGEHLYDMLLPPPFEPSLRKLWLFNAACCRRMWGRFPQKRIRRLVEVTEQYADGSATQDVWDAQYRTTMNFLENSETASRYSGVDAHELFRNFVFFDPAASLAIAFEVRDRGRVVPASEERALAIILRDIFGNPFRPVAFNPAWRTPTAVALARQMYESRDFGAMPILADALQDAGCDSDDILGHCRGPGPHVRGCWVADLVLGKA